MSSKIWSDMICEKCLKEKEQKFFLNGQTCCFSCVYQMKTSKNNKKIVKQKFCRGCKKEMFRDEKSKKRQRNVYCSLECSDRGYKEQRQNYWTRKVQVCPVEVSHTWLGNCCE